MSAIKQTILDVADSIDDEYFRDNIRKQLCCCYPIGDWRYPCDKHGDTDDDARQVREEIKKLILEVSLPEEFGFSVIRNYIEYAEIQAMKIVVGKLIERNQ